MSQALTHDAATGGNTLDPTIGPVAKEHSSLGSARQWWTGSVCKPAPRRLPPGSEPPGRGRGRACDSVCRCPIQTNAAGPITNTPSTAQCDGPYAENSRCVENSSINSPVSLQTIACRYALAQVASDQLRKSITADLRGRSP